MLHQIAVMHHIAVNLHCDVCCLQVGAPPPPSLAQALFQGTLTSCVVCCSCAYSSVRVCSILLLWSAHISTRNGGRGLSQPCEEGAGIPTTTSPPPYTSKSRQKQDRDSLSAFREMRFPATFKTQISVMHALDGLLHVCLGALFSICTSRPNLLLPAQPYTRFRPYAPFPYMCMCRLPKSRFSSSHSLSPMPS